MRRLLPSFLSPFGTLAVFTAASLAGSSEPEVGAGRPTSVRELEAAFGPPGMVVPRPAKPPVIDGNLEDPAWKETIPIRLAPAAGGWETPTQATEARVLADEQAIYCAVRCFESQPDRMAAAVYEKLGQVNSGDTVEIFLDPGHTENRLRYYRLVINPKGVLRTFCDGDHSTNWAPGVKARTAKFEGGWAVELSLTMQSFGLSKDRIPRVWGLNICRQRPELGVALPRAATGAARLNPMVRSLDEPEKYRDGEYSSWAPTYLDYNYDDSRPFSVPERFGHARLQVGTVDVPPPKRVFEVLYRADFNEGETGSFANGVLRDNSFRGAGKCLSTKPEGGALYLRHPLHDLADVTLIMTVRMPKDGRLYYYGRSPDNWQCGACRHEVFLTAEAVEERKKLRPYGKDIALFPTFDLYDTHADKAAWKPWGRVWKGPGPWKLMTGYFSEPSAGSVMHPGKDWCILRTRLGAFRRYAGRSPVNSRIPGQGLVPITQDYPNGLTFFADSRSLLIGDLVIFRGADVEPPERVRGVRVRRDRDDIEVSWEKARDNTLTAVYRVHAGKKLVAESHQLTARLRASVVGAAPLSVVAVDLYGNAALPSAPVSTE